MHVDKLLRNERYIYLIKKWYAGGSGKQRKQGWVEEY